eukprot:364429-Chlamydomonas_euryale.AAC.18
MATPPTCSCRHVPSARRPCCHARRRRQRSQLRVAQPRHFGVGSSGAAAGLQRLLRARSCSSAAAPRPHRRNAAAASCSRGDGRGWAP